MSAWREFRTWATDAPVGQLYPWVRMVLAILGGAGAGLLIWDWS